MLSTLFFLYLFFLRACTRGKRIAFYTTDRRNTNRYNTHQMELFLIETVSRWSGLRGSSVSEIMISFVIAYFIPLCCCLLFGIYRLQRGRMCETDHVRIAPLLMFFSLLTDGANAGSEKLLLDLLHPTLLEKGMVDCGVLQAMARCLRDKFGKLVSISDTTIRVSRNGKKTDCEGLVDFEHVKQVRCQLSWVWRPIQARQQKSELLEELAAAKSFTCNINPSLLSAFYVMSFSVKPREGERLDVGKYVNPNDLEPFAESFVKGIFEKPPIEAVTMMTPALQSASSENDAQKLQEEIQNVVNICGGLAHGGETINRVDFTLIEQKAITLIPKVSAAEGVEKDTSTMDNSMATLGGIEMLYQVGGCTRDIEVFVRFVFLGLHCAVTQYEVRPKSDKPSQNILD